MNYYLINYKNKKDIFSRKNIKSFIKDHPTIQEQHITRASFGKKNIPTKQLLEFLDDDRIDDHVLDIISEEEKLSIE